MVIGAFTNPKKEGQMTKTISVQAKDLATRTEEESPSTTLLADFSGSLGAPAVPPQGQDHSEDEKTGSRASEPQKEP